MAGRWAFDVTNAQTLTYDDVFGHLYSLVDFTKFSTSDPFPSETNGNGFSDPQSVTDISQFQSYSPLDLRSDYSNETHLTSSIDSYDTAVFAASLSEDVPETFRVTLAVGDWFERGSFPSNENANSLNLAVLNANGEGYGISAKFKLSTGFVDPFTSFSIFRIDTGAVISNIRTADIPFLISAPNLNYSGPNAIYKFLSDISLAYTGAGVWKFLFAGGEFSDVADTLGLSDYSLSLTDSTYARSDLNTIIFSISSIENNWIPSVRWLAITDNAHPVIDHNYLQSFTPGLSDHVSFYTDGYLFRTDQFGDPINYTSKLITGIDLTNSVDPFIDKKTNGHISGATPVFTVGIQDPLDIIDLSVINELLETSYQTISINQEATNNQLIRYIGSIDATPVQYGFATYSAEGNPSGLNMSGLSTYPSVIPSEFSIGIDVQEVGSGWVLATSLGTDTGENTIFIMTDNTAYIINTNDQFKISNLPPPEDTIIIQASHSFTGGTLHLNYLNGYISITATDNSATPSTTTLCSFALTRIFEGCRTGTVFTNVKITDFYIYGQIPSVIEDISNMTSIINPSEGLMEIIADTADFQLFNKQVSGFSQVFSENTFIDKVNVLHNFGDLFDNHRLNGEGSSSYSLTSSVDFSAIPDGDVPSTTNGAGELDPITLYDHSDIASGDYTFQSAQVVDGSFRPVEDASPVNHSSVFIRATENPNFYGPFNHSYNGYTLSAVLGEFLGAHTSPTTNEPHITIFLGYDTFLSDGYYMDATILSDPSRDENPFYTRLDLGILNSGIKSSICIREIPYIIGAGNIFSFRVDLEADDGTPEFKNVVKFMLNGMELFTLDHVEATDNHLSVNDFGVILRAESFNDWIPSISQINWSDNFYDSDMTGLYRYKFIYEYIKNHLDKQTTPPFFYLPNIELKELTSGNTAYADPSNGSNSVSIGTKLMEVISNLSDLEFDNYHGISVYGNYSDSDWAIISRYIKENFDDQVMLNLKDGPVSIQYPTLLNSTLSQSDIGIWPSDILFSADLSPSFLQSEKWKFTGTISTNGLLDNLNIVVSVLSDTLVNINYPPTFYLYDESLVEVFSGTALSGITLDIGTIGVVDETKNYTYSIEGIAQSYGNGSIKLTLSADDVDPISVSDSIVVLKGD